MGISLQIPQGHRGGPELLSISPHSSSRSPYADLPGTEPKNSHSSCRRLVSSRLDHSCRGPSRVSTREAGALRQGDVSPSGIISLARTSVFQFIYGLQLKFLLLL